MSIRQRRTARGKVVYDVYFRLPGGKRTCRRGLPWKVACELEERVKRLNAAWRAGIRITDLTVSELYEDWIESKEKRVRASTLANYKSLYEHHIKDVLGNRPILEIGPTDIQRLVDGLAARPRTANSTLTVLKSMFGQAVLWGYLDANPASEIRRIPQPERERPYLTLEEARNLLDKLEGMPRLLILTALVTGMRQGELAGLKWEDVERDRIRVRRSYRKGVFSDPKTYYGRRDVLIPPWLGEELEAVRGLPHQLVFSDDGSQPLPDWKMNRHILQPALKRAGIEKGIRFHDLRHSCAAWYISQGESPKLVQEQLGHASADFTMRRYGHLAPDAKAAAVSRFGEAISGLVSKKHQEQNEQNGNVVRFPQLKGSVRP